MLAAVRSATVGMPVTSTAVAPFAEGTWLFSHNGIVRGWPDSALLWALVRHRLRQGDAPATALVETVHTVAATAPGSRLNLLLTDGSAVWATTWTHALSVRAAAGAVTVSSEPTDDGPGWTPVPDRHLVVAGPDRCDIRPLDAAARAA